MMLIVLQLLHFKRIMTFIISSILLLVLIEFSFFRLPKIVFQKLLLLELVAKDTNGIYFGVIYN
jgi:hypothetical protein